MSDEIKSTMEKVMERLAAMDAAGSGAAVDHGGEERQREGMRRAAAYLRGEQSDLATLLAAAPEGERDDLRKGMARTLLRNIFLPREEEQLQPAEAAMAGLLQLAGSGGELLQAMGEMKKILEQYLAHGRQLRQQLADQFAQQMAAMEGNMARQTGVNMQLSPEQHPKFQEEWQRIQDELDSQYGRALSQYKEQLGAMLGQ